MHLHFAGIVSLNWHKWNVLIVSPVFAIRNPGARRAFQGSNILGVFVRDAAAVQVDAEQRQGPDERACRAEVVPRLAAATVVDVP